MPAAINPLSLYMALGGVALGALGAVLLFRRIRLLLSGRRATGEIIGWARQRWSDPPSEAFLPKVRFVADGAPQEFQSSVSASPDRWPIGTPVPVLYRPERPQDAQIAIAWRFWAGPVGVLVFAAAVLAGAWKAAT